MDLNVNAATLIAAVVIANIAVIVGAYVSIKVTVGQLEIMVKQLQKDVDALFNKHRTIEK